MPQLVERSLLTLEVRGSNPVIGKIYLKHLLSRKDDNTKEKHKPGIVHFKTVLLKEMAETIMKVLWHGGRFLHQRSTV